MPGKVLHLDPFPALTEIIHKRHAADHVPHLSCLSPGFLSVFRFYEAALHLKDNLKAKRKSFTSNHFSSRAMEENLVI